MVLVPRMLEGPLCPDTFGQRTKWNMRESGLGHRAQSLEFPHYKTEASTPRLFIGLFQNIPGVCTRETCINGSWMLTRRYSPSWGLPSSDSLVTEKLEKESPANNRPEILRRQMVKKKNACVCGTRTRGGGRAGKKERRRSRSCQETLELQVAQETRTVRRKCLGSVPCHVS